MVDEFNEESAERYPSEIAMVSFRNSTRYYWYNDQKIEQLSERIRKSGDAILDLISELEAYRAEPTP